MIGLNGSNGILNEAAKRRREYSRKGAHLKADNGRAGVKDSRLPMGNVAMPDEGQPQPLVNNARCHDVKPVQINSNSTSGASRHQPGNRRHQATAGQDPLRFAQPDQAHRAPKRGDQEDGQWPHHALAHFG